MHSYSSVAGAKFKVIDVSPESTF